MPARFVTVDRETPLLLPPDLRDWVAKDDIVRFIIDAVAECDLRPARTNLRGSGSQQYPPGMMLALLIFCYANRIFSSRQIEQATYSHVSLRFLCANEHPDHDTIATFRRENQTLLENCFLRVLQYARELKAFSRLGTVSIDGTKLAARASQRSNRDLGQLEKEISDLQGEIAGLMQAAESAEARESAEPSVLATKLQDKTARQQALRAAAAKLQARQRAEYEQARQQRRDADLELPPDPPEGSPPAASTATPAPAPASEVPASADPAPTPAAASPTAPCKPLPKRFAKQRINLVEPDSRVMCDAHGNFFQGYNIQAVVAAGDDRSQLVTGIRVTNAGNDRRLLAENLASVPAPFRPEIEYGLLDKGYDHADLIAAVERKHPGLIILCPPQNPAPATDAPATKRRLKKGEERRRARAAAMRERLEDPAHKQRYKRRSASVEPVFGVFKNVLGFRRFRLFGLAKAGIEITLLAIAYNLRQLARLAARNEPQTA